MSWLCSCVTFREPPTFSLFVYQAAISIVIEEKLFTSRADVATFNPLIELPGRSRARGIKLLFFCKHLLCGGCVLQYRGSICQHRMCHQSTLTGSALLSLLMEPFIETAPSQFFSEVSKSRFLSFLQCESIFQWSLHICTSVGTLQIEREREYWILIINMKAVPNEW